MPRLYVELVNHVTLSVHKIVNITGESSGCGVLEDFLSKDFDVLRTYFCEEELENEITELLNVEVR